MRAEFQAVVLAAGKGSRMTELTGSIAKCLLPIGNRPMIHYPLIMLQQAGFKDILLIVPDIHESEVRTELDGKYPLQIEYFAVPANRDLGTADSLRLAFKKIWSDIVLVSCDTITDFPLKKLINFHRIRNATLSALITSEPTTSFQGSVPGRKGKFKTDNDLIGIDPRNDNRLVFLNSEADFEDEISLPFSLFRQCQYMELNGRYLDGHLYVIKRSALQVLNEKPHLSSIKGELVPYLLKLQFKRFKTNVNERDNSAQDSSGTLNTTSERPSLSGSLLRTLAKEDSIGKALQKLSITTIELDRSFDLVRSYPDTPLQCYAYVLNTNYRLSRANHLLAYVELNKISRSLLESLCGPIDDKPMQCKATISEDSVVNRSCKVSDRCTLRNCVIAAGCNIADKSLLTNCVLMRDVQVAEGCILQNCILCPGVVLSEKCHLKDCIVGSNQSLKQASKLSNEIVVNYDQMMEF